MENTNDEITNLGDVISVNARRQPGRPAVVYGDVTLSFSDVERRSNQVANGLYAEGFCDKPRVAILDRNSELFFDVLFGVAKTRGVLVTINFRLTPGEIEYILLDSCVEVLFVGAEFVKSIDTFTQKLPGLKKIIVLDDRLSSNFAQWRDSNADTALQQAIDPESAVVQMYTSGTTGYPKGVVLSHRAMLNGLRVGLSVWPFLYEPGSRVLATMPLFHIAATNLCLTGLYAGACCEIVREASPEELVDIIATHGVNIVPLPATLIHSILGLDSIDEKDFSALKIMLIAGSGIAEELLREAARTFKCGFALAYGSTETCGGVTYLGPDECTADAGNRLKSAGKCMLHSEVKIVDQKGRELPPGETGEIIVRSNRLLSGYWGKPEATAESLRDGWFYSGDAGYLDDDGYLFIVDRIKDMVLTGGENVYPIEIEQAMHTHPAVENVAVVGIPDDKWGEALLAFVIIKTDVGQPTAEELEKFLRDRLAGFKVPRKYEFVESFPLNATGKVLKRVLREPYWKDKNRQVG